MTKAGGSLCRRTFLKAAGAAGLSWGFSARSATGWEEASALPPIRQITRGPKFHWFGYYDKLEFDPTGRFVLGMEVGFEHRSPQPDDVIKVGMVDREQNDEWIELGESRAWCWQQGCMLQWRPGSRNEVLWNDRQQDRFVCHVLNVDTRERQTLDNPIYSVSPDGRWAVSLDFRRTNETRPGYGYSGLPDPHRDVLAPRDSGIFVVDLTTGHQELAVSLADAAAIPLPGHDFTRAKSQFEHLLINPDGTRFEFLHRWGYPTWKGETRMLTAARDGSDVRVIDPSGKTSHFIWRDPHYILAWSWHASHNNGFYLFEDRASGTIEIVGKDVMTVNGHCTYLPGNQWILNDTYPDRQRLQHPYLYHVPTGKRVPLGHFATPAQYAGEWRCDTHPRFSPDGKWVVIDSPHSGQGRQLHLIDIGSIVG